MDKKHARKREEKKKNTQKELSIQNNPLWLVFQALGRPQNSENTRAKMIQFFGFLLLHLYGNLLYQ